MIDKKANKFKIFSVALIIAIIVIIKVFFNKFI